MNFPFTNNNSEFKQKLQTMSARLSRLKLAQKMGMSHNGNRDYWEAYGYEENPDASDYYAQYKRHGIARAVVDRPVGYTWQGEVEIAGDENEQLKNEFGALNNELDLSHTFSRLDKLAQLGQFAVLLLGFDDTNGNGWNQEVQSGSSLQYVKPVGQWNVSIDQFVKDASNKRFGQPKTYSITIDDISGSKSLTVHHSRIIHVAYNTLESDVYGHPKMEAIYNRLVDLVKLVGGSAEMFWRGARPGLAGNAEPEADLPDDAGEMLNSQFDEYENNLRRVLLTEGIDLESLAQQIADPSGHVKVQYQMVSAVTGIPTKILIGSERGKLASEQDMKTWLTTIGTRRSEQAEPTIVRPFIERVQKYGSLPDADEYSLQWSDLFGLSKKDKAEIGKTLTSALATYSKSPVSEELVPFEDWATHFLGIDEEIVEEFTQNADEEIQDELGRQAELEGELDE